MAHNHPDPNPYVGPRPFENKDQDIRRFYGRKAETRNVISLIIAHRTFLLYGQSGTGKSSLLNAALIPGLQAKGYHVLLPPARVQGGVSKNMPDFDQIDNIFVFFTLASWSKSESDLPKLAKSTLSDFFSRTPVRMPEAKPTLRIIIFDQFEELFTAFPERWGDREGFFQQISQALNADPLLRAVFIIREDYLAEIESYASILPERLGSRFRLERLRETAALEAITEPLSESKRHFSPMGAKKLVTDLMTVPFETAGGTKSTLGEFVEPVQLQVVCQRLWDLLPGDVNIINQEHIEAFGKVDLALSGFYENCIQVVRGKTKVKENQLRNWFENELITPAGTRGIVFRGSKTTGDIPNAAIDELEDLHIIRAETRAGSRWYELSHDRFIEPIRKSNQVYRFQTRQVKRLGIVATFAAVLLLFAIIIGYTLFTYNRIISKYHFQMAALTDYGSRFQTAKILDINGDLIAELNSQDGGARTSVPLDQISPFMIHAVISLEEEDFFDDPGWDWITIGRAILQNTGSDQLESGTRNITRQIAEQLVLRQSTTTPDLKLREIVIAAEIAKQYSKEFILQLYLNEIFFGNQSYGVEAAAQFYFGVSANDLNLPQSALLAGMISAPATYNPVEAGDEDLATYNQRREAAFGRMEFVMNRMQQVGCLPIPGQPASGFCVDATIVRQATVDIARVKAARYEPRGANSIYPHFTAFVTSQVERLFGTGEMFRRGFVIRTTLNPAVQDIAESALDQTMAALIQTGINTGSVMAVDPRTGAIRAMVGSPDFNNETINGQANGAVTFQQPGSSIKPIVYTGALEGADSNGDGILDYLTPASILWDVPTTFPNTNPPYSPVNFDRQFHGPQAVRYALQNSYNIPAIKAYQYIGEAKFRDVATRLGLVFPENAMFGLPTGIGATETTLYSMVQAYSTLANNGIRVPLHTIESITNSDGTPVHLPERPTSQAIQPQIAYIMSNILSDDTARGSAFPTNGWLTINGLPTTNVVAAKTGTTDGARDLWTMGYTRNAVVGVWLGRPDNNTTLVQDGGYGSAAPLWNRVMTTMLGTMPRPEGFANPGGVVQAQICATTGTLPPANCPSLRAELFLQSQPPPSADQSFVRNIEIDTWTGLLTNEFCPDNREAATVINITDAAAVSWLNSAAAASTAAQLGITSATIANPPTQACDLNTEVPIARITYPAEGQILIGTVPIIGAATATSFDRFQLYYAPASSLAFTAIANPSTVPQSNGLLSEWDTTAVPNGNYILRLQMFSKNGGYLMRTVNISVSNISGTPVPTYTPFVVTPSEIFSFSTLTPIPFDEVTPGP